MKSMNLLAALSAIVMAATLGYAAAHSQIPSSGEQSRPIAVPPLSAAEMGDLETHYATNVTYPDRYAGRYFEITGNVEKTNPGSDFMVVISSVNKENTNAWCSSISGSIPNGATITVGGRLSSHPFDRDEVGNSYYLEDCRAVSASTASLFESGSRTVSGNSLSELDQALIGKKEYFCNRSFCQGTFTKASGLDTDEAMATFGETKADAKQNCFENAFYNGDEETPLLRSKCARVLPNLENVTTIRANCISGQLEVLDGQGNQSSFGFEGLNPRWGKDSDDGTIPTQYLIRFSDGTFADGSMASDYDRNLGYMRDLCPTLVPD